MEAETKPPIPPEWVQQVRARGLSGALGVALDVIEPFGPLGAQVLWVAGPALSLVVPRAAITGLAEALEQPGGIERLRQALEA
jgi:hypothetical protein